MQCAFTLTMKQRQAISPQCLDLIFYAHITAMFHCEEIGVFPNDVIARDSGQE